jgi:sulfur-oxidizing protein SoxY
MGVDMKRRLFLKGALATGTVTVLAASGLLIPRSLVAVWPREAFAAEDISTALELLLGSAETKKTRAIRMKLTPHAASAGAEVSVVIETSIADIESVSLLVADEPTPLVASFQFGADVEGRISTRLKISKSGDILAVVKTGQRLFYQRKHVDLSACGCE